MKKKVGWGFILSLAFILFMPETVEAQDNALNELTVDVELLENGTAIISEERQMDMHEGTELFILIEEVEGVEVLDFEVEGMTEETDWDSDDSREEKAGTYGMIEVNDGQELAWGIGDYGNNTYELTYTVTNMVRQLEDGQALFWNFNTFGDIPPETASIQISGPSDFVEDNTRIWGFGYEGQIDLQDGELVTYTEGQMDEGRPFEVLMQFSNDPFIPVYYEDQTLAEQAEEAEEVTSSGESRGDTHPAVIVGIIGAFAIPGVALVAYFIRLDYLKKERGVVPNTYQQGKRNKGMAYTDVPYKEGGIIDIAYFLNQLQRGSLDQYIFAYLLKWSKDNCIEIETTDHKQKRKQQTILTFNPKDFKKQEENDLNISEFESELWKTLYEATDSREQMTNKEMEKWAKKNVKVLQKLDKNIQKESKDRLLKERYITEETVKLLGIEHTFEAITQKGQRLYDRLAQFDNHLGDLESDETLTYRQLIPEENFLIWASLYGKEEELITRLEELMPNWTEEQDVIPHFYTGYYGLHVFSGSMQSGMSSGGYAGTGGVGGATSVGGGGGSVGGGGGGAR